MGTCLSIPLADLLMLMLLKVSVGIAIGKKFCAVIVSAKEIVALLT